VVILRDHTFFYYPENILPTTLTAEKDATRTDPWVGRRPSFVACDGR
jgi:hypothetical protein